MNPSSLPIISTQTDVSTPVVVRTTVIDVIDPDAVRDAITNMIATANADGLAYYTSIGITTDGGSSKGVLWMIFK